MQPSLRVGLEVGPKSLKVAWVTRRPQGGMAWRYRAQPRRPASNPGALRRDLAQLLRPLRRHRHRAQLILAAPHSYLRWFTVQVPDAGRIPDAVQEQLPQLLPFDVTHAQFQFLVRRRQQVGEQLECSVSVAACERAALQHDLDALWEVGWVPNRVIPAALALVRTAKALGALDQDAAVLVEIGASRTVMVLVDAAEAVYARDVMFGEDQLIEALTGQTSLGSVHVSLSREQAEALVRAEGIPEAASATDLSGGPTVGRTPLSVAMYLAIIQPVLEQLVSEIRRTMTYGADTVTAAVPRRLIISGEGSRLPRCVPWLSKQLGIPVARLNCEQFLGAEGSAAAVVCGLALFERRSTLDLQPRASRQRGLLVRRAAQAWQALVVLALVLWTGAGWWQVRRHAVAGQFGALQAQWSSLQHLVELQEAVERREQLARRLTAGDAVSLEWFHRLARGFPKPVRLTRLSVDAGRQVSLAGEAQGWEQTPEAYVSELTLWLERTTLCEGVRLGSTRRVGANGNLVQFDLTCTLPGPS